jgi:hypothetical protein
MSTDLKGKVGRVVAPPAGHSAANDAPEPLGLATAMKSATDPRVLGTIAMEKTAVSVWYRSLEDSLPAWIERSIAVGFVSFVAELHVSDVGAMLEEAFEGAGCPPDPERAAFVRDVDDLARRFSEIAMTPRLRLRLGAVDRVVCPRFHIDALRARLICTYFGRGTEFGAARPDGAPRRVIELPTGAVGVFRGLHWPGHETTGVVHRSPQTAPGETRLVLVIDPDEDAPWQ